MMRLKMMISCVVLLVVSFVFGTMLGKYAANKMTEEEPLVTVEGVAQEENISAVSQIQNQYTPEPMETIKPTTYFLVLSDRKICVYEIPPEGDAVFIYDAPCEIAQLRQEDYERLCRGIKVSDLEEARSLTEDFGS